MSSVVVRGTSFALRIGQLAFAAVIAGIGSTYIRSTVPKQTPNNGFLYAVILATVSITLSVIWLLPFLHTFKYFIVDFTLSIAWFVAFGIFIMVSTARSDCDHNTFNWSHVTDSGDCNQIQAVKAFSFLSACVWFASFLLGIVVVLRERRERKKKAQSKASGGGSKA